MAEWICIAGEHCICRAHCLNYRPSPPNQGSGGKRSDDLTLRDQFAMAALPALIARHRADVAWSRVAPLAYEIADAMMKARGK